MRQKHLHEFVRILPFRFGFQNNANRCIATGFIPDGVQNTQKLLAQGDLFCRQGFFTGADFRIGDFLDFLEYFLGGGAGWQVRKQRLAIVLVPVPRTSIGHVP